MATPGGPPPSLAYVIPAYRAADTLGATLRSLRAQTRPDWEAVVVDDESPDDLARVVELEPDPRVRLVRRPNGGPARARELGLRLTQAPAVCFLDADDAAEPTHAADLLAALSAHPGADVAAGELRAITPDGKPLAHRARVHPAALDDDQVMQGNPVQFGAAVIRRPLLERVIARFGDLMDPACHCEDWEFWMRAAACGARLAPPVERVVLRYTRALSTRSRGQMDTFASGLRAIRTHSRSAQDADRWARLLSVRTLGRAVATHDAALASAARAGLSRLEPADDSALAASIHGQLALDLPDDPGAWASARSRVQEALRQFIPAHPAKDLLALRATITPAAWAVVAQHAADQVRPGRTLVLFGLGQNGRRVADHLVASGRPAVYIDDNPGATGPLPRISEAELSPRHVVLVTPFDRDAILSRLARTNVADVLLPENLVA